ncbi:Eco57I restriction-modification methylase domain-containing protein [Kytococcus sp. Marseille-QA3725]
MPQELRSSRKARGAFFTPTVIADHLARWAVRPGDRVLEPSCGEAVFVEASARALQELGAPAAPGQLLGVDVHGPSIEAARRRLTSEGVEARLVVSDFFAWAGQGDLDVVLGNPPYIRYQDFTGEFRAQARAAALAAGVGLSALASSWAAFVVHSATQLRPGGRLGMVLPAEILTVNYAAPVRAFLTRHFEDLRLVGFDARVFPDAQEEVVLLLARGWDPDGASAGTLAVARVSGAEALDGSPLTFRSWTPPDPEARWNPAFGWSQAYERWSNSAVFSALSEWGAIGIGAVTGRNSYFAVSCEAVGEWGLDDGSVVPLCPPGSRHLRGIEFTDLDWAMSREEGRKVHLFRPPGDPSTAAQRYIEHGVDEGVDRAYKCRVRSPWWRVPLMPVADLFVTYMNADTVSFCANTARVRHLNSVHGLVLHAATRDVDPRALAVAAVNSVTELGVELVGRAYGGGMLKVEPREAQRIPLPSPEWVRRHEDELLALADQWSGRRDVRAAGLRDAVDALLACSVGVEARELGEMQDLCDLLRGRRSARAGRK